MRGELLDHIIVMPAIANAMKYHSDAEQEYDPVRDADMNRTQYLAIMAIIGFVDGGGSLEAVENIMRESRIPSRRKMPSPKLRLVKI